MIRKFLILKKTFLLSAAFALLLSLLFVSCQKELSVENAAKDGGTAQYSFDGGTGSCPGAIVSGSFTAGVAVTAANTVTLSVTVDSIGTYIISTDTNNGITFSGTGVFTDIGVQDITLTASGTPVAAGVNDFTPVADGCTFSVTVGANSGGASGTAVYSLDGGTSSCTDAAVNGTFTAGTAVSSANNVILKVNVTQVGSYTISTNSVNGISFTGTGSFTNTGAQTVTLTASGTPAAAGTFAFIPGSNGCTFNVAVGSGSTSGGNTGGNSSIYLRCKINGVLTNFNTNLGGYYVTPPSAGIPYSISARGKNSDVAGSAEELWVNASNPTAPTTGVYNNGTFASGITDRMSQVALYPTGFPNPFWGSSALTANTLSVNITSVSTSAAAGTFQGTIYENNGIGPSTKQITEGEFKISF